MPIDVLRRETRLALYGEAPDHQAHCLWQRWADDEIAAAASDGVVQLVRRPRRDRR